MTLATIIGLSGVSLLLSAVILKLLLILKLPLNKARIIALLVFIASFIPVEGYSLSLYLRGLFNDLSITTLCLLLLFLYRPQVQHIQSRSVFILTALAGLLLYPFALGYSPVDPYAWGYLNQSHGLTAPLTVTGLLLFLAAYAFIKQNTLLMACIMTSIIAWQLNLLESRNIWDYLLDPLLWLYSLYQLPVIIWRHFHNKASSQ